MKLLKSIFFFLTIISCSTPINEKTNDFSALIDLEGNAFNLDDLKKYFNSKYLGNMVQTMYENRV